MSFLDSQKTQSIVGIANLAQNKKINKSLEELRKTQEEAAKNARHQADLQKEANKLEQKRLSTERQRLSAQENAARSAKMQLQIQQQAEQRRILREEEEERLKEELKIKKQTIFNARQDVKAILKSDKNKIEKFFDLNAISFSLKDSKIIATDFDDYVDKEYLAQTESELDDAIKATHKTMNEEEVSDLEKINEVLLINEEAKLKNIKKKLKRKKQSLEATEQSIQDIDGIKALSALESIIEKHGKS